MVIQAEGMFDSISYHAVSAFDKTNLGVIFREALKKAGADLK